MGWAEQIILVGQVALAGLLGGVVGLEREITGKAAGLRTHMFVAMSAALFVILSRLLPGWFAESVPSDTYRADPTRVIQAIAVGISFIGAGMIFRPNGHIEGLTTAASTLLVSAVGIAVGIGHWILACGVTILAVIVLLMLRRVERFLHVRRAGADSGPDRMT